MKSKYFIQLSKQQIIDCTNNSMYENLGCEGGYISTSLQYVIDNGLVSDNQYPFLNKVFFCF